MAQLGVAGTMTSEYPWMWGLTMEACTGQQETHLYDCSHTQTFLCSALARAGVAWQLDQRLATNNDTKYMQLAQWLSTCTQGRDIMHLTYTYIHTYVRTYVRTYIHTYIYIHTSGHDDEGVLTRTMLIGCTDHVCAHVSSFHVTKSQSHRGTVVVKHKAEPRVSLTADQLEPLVGFAVYLHIGCRVASYYAIYSQVSLSVHAVRPIISWQKNLR